MKKLIFWLMLALATLICNDAANAQSYIPTVTSSPCIANGAGDLVTSGSLIIVGTDQNDNPIPYRINGTAQATTSPISRTITNGALATSLQLANPALTSPVGVLYRIAIQDNVTKRITVYKQVIIAANSGSNFDLCAMNAGPSFAPVTTITNPGTLNGNIIQNGDVTVNARFITIPQTITFSATPTFDCSLTSGGSYFRIVLTGNVTSSTLSNCSSGQHIWLNICQDATGSRTFIFPTNIQGPATIVSTASTCTAQFFIFDGTLAKAVSDTVNPTVSVLNGVSFPASPSTHAVPVITGANTATYKVIPDCQDVTGNHLDYTQSSDTWSCGTSVPANTLTTLVNWQGPASAVVGTGADANVYTFSIPANTMQAGKGISISVGWQHTTGTASVTYKMKFGATTISTNAEAGTNPSALVFYVMNNPGSTSAQTAWQEARNNNSIVYVTQFASPAENTTGSVTLSFTFNVAATDQVTPKFLLIQQAR